MLDGTEVEWAGEGRIDEEGQSLLFRDVGDRSQVDDPHQRVGWSFHEDRPGGFPYRLAPVPRLLGTDVTHLDAEPGQLLVEEVLGSAVNPTARDEVIAGPEDGEMGQGRGSHPTGDENGIVRSLEKSVLLREGQ